jgi:NitT/TauT family transport system substrate-binding protein
MGRTSWQLRCLAGVLCFLLAVGQVATVQDLKKVRLRLDFSAVGYHAPFFLGVGRGFYREQGIDREVLEGKGSSSSASLVAPVHAKFLTKFDAD